MGSTSARERLYEIFSGKAATPEASIGRGLELGAEYLDLSIGFFTRIEEGTQRIVQSVGDHPLIQPGETCPLDEAYCRRTIQLESPLAVQNATTSSAIAGQAVRTFDLGTYIGGTVTVDEETYGTVCFADRDERETGFTDAERHFVETLATFAGHALERRAYERELDEREAQLDKRDEIYRATINASFDLVFRVDTAGEVTFVSESVGELLGAPPGEYIGRPFTTLLPDEEAVELFTRTYEPVLNGRTVEEEYLPLESRRQESVVVDLRMTPIYASDVPRPDRTPADIVGVQGAARDATERLRRERLIRVLNRVLRHNLRNDVTVIGGHAGLLTERLSGENEHLAARIVETSDRLVNLTESARRLEKHLDSAPELEPTDVVPVVERASKQTDERYPDADIRVDTPPGAVAQGAPRLETAVWELLDNAAKHAGEQPTVSVEVTSTVDHVDVRVADDGPGLPEMERSVLETGEETALVHGGGLGLWLVYWIVESLSGEVRVRDAAEGACVELRLRANARSGVPDDSRARYPHEGRDDE